MQGYRIALHFPRRVLQFCKKSLNCQAAAAQADAIVVLNKINLCRRVRGARGDRVSERIAHAAAEIEPDPA